MSASDISAVNEGTLILYESIIALAGVPVTNDLLSKTAYAALFRQFAALVGTSSVNVPLQASKSSTFVKAGGAPASLTLIYTLPECPDSQPPQDVNLFFLSATANIVDGLGTIGITPIDALSATVTFNFHFLSGAPTAANPNDIDDLLSFSATPLTYGTPIVLNSFAGVGDLMLDWDPVTRTLTISITGGAGAVTLSALGAKWR